MSGVREGLFGVSAVALALCLSTAAGFLVAGCASDFGGDFFPSKKTNLTLSQFETVASLTAAGGAAGGTAGGAAGGAAGGTGGGSTAGANGGTEGPLGGNPTRFIVRFDPFPGGASLLLNRTTGSSAADVSSDNRTSPILIEVTFRGHDVNGNAFQIVSFLPATGSPDATTLSGATGAVGGAGAGTAQTGGTQITTLRPQISRQQAIGGGGGGGGGAIGPAVTEFFSSEIGASMTITNGISCKIEQQALRYFESDGTLAPISAFAVGMNMFLEANPIKTGFGSTAGGGA